MTRRDRRTRRWVLLPPPVLLLCVVAFATTAHPVSAAWIDTGTTTQTLGALSVGPPTPLACTDSSSNYVDITWSHVDVAYAYAWQIVRVRNGTVAGSGTITPSSPSGSTVSLRVSPTLLTLDLQNPRYDVQITSFLISSPTWKSPPSISSVHAQSLLTIGLSVRCGAG